MEKTMWRFEDNDLFHEKKRLRWGLTEQESSKAQTHENESPEPTVFLGIFEHGKTEKILTSANQK